MTQPAVGSSPHLDPLAEPAGFDDSGSHPRSPRIGILVVAYNAATTLASVLDRIPAEVRGSIEEVIVADDASPDGGSTYLVGLGYQSRGSDLPLTVIRHEKNLG
ncbi:MAG: glycosyltransferase, partial [Acidimicrobiales bacterium]